MANANHAEKNRLRSFGGVLLTPQTNCPIAAGGVGLWLDESGVFKLRNADGSDTLPASKTPTTRAISTSAPLTGGGDLSADRTLAISTAAVTSGGEGNAGKAVVLDAHGKLAGRVVETDGAKLDTIQSGTTLLAAGVSPVIAAAITASSRIFSLIKTMTPGAGNLTVEYGALAADRVVGAPGSFKITALLSDGAINALDTSALDWMVVG